MPVVSGAWRPADRRGALRVRCGLGRGRYRVIPGLYALGRPGPDSPVLVTANYKLSFDTLRRDAGGLDAWILVLDTGGVNVWCSAGKGTFGTEEVARQVRESRLAEVVAHRRLILPQLAGPGVAAHRLPALCGFQGVFGPVRARDIPEYLSRGGRAAPAMRRVSFTAGERALLVPVELAGLLPWLAILLPVLYLAGRLAGGGAAAGRPGAGLFSAIALLAAVLAGAALTPLLLPWLPGRAFSLKGLWPGLAAGLLLAAWGGGAPATLAWLLVVPAVSSFLALNFTGASTYTSLSGVRREMRRALPLQVAAAALGMAFWVLALLRGWGGA